MGISDDVRPRVMTRHGVAQLQRAEDGIEYEIPNRVRVTYYLEI